MQTTAGIKLTKKQIKQVKALQKLAKDWDDNLWLFAAAGKLCVMLEGGTEQNPNPTFNKVGGCFAQIGGGVNQENIIEIIDGITCDGGDW